MQREWVQRDAKFRCDIQAGKVRDDLLSTLWHTADQLGITKAWTGSQEHTERIDEVWIGGATIGAMQKRIAFADEQVADGVPWYGLASSRELRSNEIESLNLS